MKTKIILLFLYTFSFSLSSENDDEDIFTDYCRSGLCKYNGGDGMHSGCRDGIRHNGKFQYPPCPDNAELIPLSEQDRQDILDFHNEQRNYVACGGLYKEFGIRPGCRHAVMTWDKELERTAFLHTSYCTFAHDKCRNTLKYPLSGQNLGIMTYVGKHLNATAHINVISYLWYIEYRLTKMAVIDSFYHQTEVMVGHFLTSLNERNNRVGCTFAKFYFAEKKKEAVMLSCNYPTTNIGKGTIYNSCKEPASKCTTGTDPKYKFLCSTKEEYDVSGRLKLIPYDGDGSEVFDNCGRRAEMFHLEKEGSEEVEKQHKFLYPNETNLKPPVVTTPKPPEVTTPKPPLVTTPKPSLVTTEKPITDATYKPGNDDEEIFTDYCRSGLCKYTGGDGMHSGCRDGIRHNGKFQYPPCPDNAELIPLSDSDKQDILDFHNEQRNYVACGGLYKEHGIRPGCRHAVMTWDKELEQTAFLHTSYCTFAHDKCRNTLKYPVSGQNLGIMTYAKKHLNATAYINVISYLWYVEYRLTKVDMIDSFYHQTEVMVGHFLTSLNERNSRVGCTFAKFYFAEKKKEAVMLSCNYPTTNIGKGTIYNSCKEPASKCTTGTDPKYKFLCSTKEEYNVSGRLKFIPYDGDGTEVFDNCGRLPEMLHLEKEGSEEVEKHDKLLYPNHTTTTARPTQKPTDKPTMKPTIKTTAKPIVTTTSKPTEGDEDVFTDYCTPGLCKYNGGDGMHSGCRDGIRHDGKFQYPPCPDNAAMIPLSESDKQDILDFHNEQRNFVACGGLYKDYGIKPGCRHGVMRWDKELEKTAFLHTSYCTFAHDKCRNTLNYPFSGQNLGILTYVGKHLNATAYSNVISYLWYIEYRLTKVAMIESYYHQTEVMVGHFLTSVNERNNRIGCTCAKFYYAEKKKEAFMLSCNYPTTNIGKGTIYNSCKVPASKCTTGTDPKYKFLCSSKEEYDVSGKLKLIPFDGDGSEVYNNCGRQPELFHLEHEGHEEVKKQDQDFIPNPDGGGGGGGGTTPKPIVTTPKPTVKPPGKPDVPDGGNPDAGGTPDYSEHEYDPPDSGCSIVISQNSLKMFINFYLIVFYPLLRVHISV